MLYIEMNAQCDKLAKVVSESRPSQVLSVCSTVDGRQFITLIVTFVELNCQVAMIDVSWRNFLSLEFVKSSRGKYPYFGNTLISLKRGVGWVERSVRTKTDRSRQPF